MAGAFLAFIQEARTLFVSPFYEKSKYFKGFWEFLGIWVYFLKTFSLFLVTLLLFLSSFALGYFS